MTYPSTQIDVEFVERIDEVIHAAMGFLTEVLDFGFMGKVIAFVAMSFYIGCLTVQEGFRKGHQ